MAHYPVTISSFIPVHYGQIVVTERFAYFDYGCEKNQMIYNQNNCEPPLIPLDKIKLKKIAIFYSSSDIFCRPADVKVLKTKLKGNFSMKIPKLIILIFN